MAGGFAFVGMLWMRRFGRTRGFACAGSTRPVRRNSPQRIAMMFKRYIALLAACVSVLMPAKMSSASEVLGTALSKRAPQISGTVEGSIQQMSGETVSVDGGGVITGTLKVPGLP